MVSLLRDFSVQSGAEFVSSCFLGSALRLFALIVPVMQSADGAQQTACAKYTKNCPPPARVILVPRSTQQSSQGNGSGYLPHL